VRKCSTCSEAATCVRAGFGETLGTRRDSAGKLYRTKEAASYVRVSAGSVRTCLHTHLRRNSPSASYSFRAREQAALGIGNRGRMEIERAELEARSLVRRSLQLRMRGVARTDGVRGISSLLRRRIFPVRIRVCVSETDKPSSSATVDCARRVYAGGYSLARCALQPRRPQAQESESRLCLTVYPAS